MYEHYYNKKLESTFTLKGNITPAKITNLFINSDDSNDFIQNLEKLVRT